MTKTAIKPDSANHNSSTNPNILFSSLPPPDIPISFPPEWSDAEIGAEKWFSKHAFEDPECAIPFLPRHIRISISLNGAGSSGNAEGEEGGFLKRFCDLPGVVTNELCIVAPNSTWDDTFLASAGLPSIGSHPEIKPAADGANSLVVPTPEPPPTIKYQRRGSATQQNMGKHSAKDQPVISKILDAASDILHDSAQSLNSISRSQSVVLGPKDGSNISHSVKHGDEIDYTSNVSKLTAANKHLLPSSFMTNLLSFVHFLFDHARISKMNPTGEEIFMPWDCIYPKGKDGIPMYNTSGKYAVKLFWMGSWRKVFVDDRVPVDSTGKNVLLVSPNLNELWPTLLSKAILKLAVSSYKDDIDSGEFGDFDLFAVLRGWIPERIAISPGTSSIHQVTGLLASILHKQVKQSSRSRADSVSPAVRSSFAVNPSITPSLSSRSSNIFPIIFGFRKEADFRAYSLKGGPFYQQVPCAYRIIETHKMVGVSSRGFLVRQYLSAGIKKGNTAKSEDIDFSDHWLLAEELTSIFSNLTIYHTPGSFRSVKHSSSILDGQVKQSDIIRIPLIFHTSQDLLLSNESGALVMLNTFGKITSTANNGACMLIEEVPVKGPSKEPVIRAATNGSASFFLSYCAGAAYRISIEANTCYHISIYSKDDFQLDEEGKYLTDFRGLKLREFEDTLAPQQPGTWSIIFKHVMIVNEPSFLSCNFYSSDSLMSSTSIRAINNDTGEELEQAGYNLTTTTLSPNKNGYTLVGESRAITSRPATKWKLRLYSDTITSNMIEKELFTTKMSIQDINEAYALNRHNILFRSLIKIKDGLYNPNNLSIQIDFSISGISLDLVLYDNDVEISRAKGKGVVSIYNILLHPSEDAPVNIKGGPGANPGNASNKQAAASIASNNANTQLQSNPPKHKYILQCSISRHDAEKLTNAAYIADYRPNSRNEKAISSAGKKKKPPGGQLATTPNIAANNNILNSPASGIAASNSQSGQSDLPDFTWHARYISTDGSSLVIVKDTEKEDRYRSIKDLWEVNAAGRATKARELRDQYPKMLDLGLKPLTIAHQDKTLKSWSIFKGELAPKYLVQGNRSVPGIILLPAIIETLAPVPPTKESSKVAANLNITKNSRPNTAFPSEEAAAISNLIFSLTSKHVSTGCRKVLSQFEELGKERSAEITKFQESQAEIVKKRGNDKDNRQVEKKRLFDIVEAKLKEFEIANVIDVGRREIYRNRILAEREEEAQARAKAMMDASKAAELAGESEEASDKKAGRKVKK